MAEDTPIAILTDTTGTELPVQDGAPIPAGTPALLLAGDDGTGTARVLSTDPTGALNINGSITATNPSVGVDGAAQPLSSTQVGGSDGANLQAARVHDLDTGIGEEFDLGVSLRLPGAGGSVVGGTATAPLRTDPTGTTVQPISAASLPLPAGASTEATLSAVATSVSSIDADIDVPLSSRASEATLASILTGLTALATEGTLTAVLAQLDVALSTRASEATLGTRASETTVTSILAQLDVALSTRASQATVASILSALLATLAVQGTGTAGAQAGGVLTVQGDPAGTPIPISGAITATNPSVGVDGAVAPLSSTQIGGPDGGGLLQPANVLAAAPAGAENGLVTRNIPSGTQPVSAASLPLPAGAATEATLATRASEVTVASILAQLDVALSTRASQATLVAVLAQLDVALSTRAAASTQTDGTQKTVVRGGTKGVTVPADVTSTSIDADHQALDVAVKAGSITVVEASVGLNGAAAPTSSTQEGGPDAAGNLEAARVYDVDTGAGTEYVRGVSLRKAASGGSVEAGTLVDPLRTDPTGATTQPVSAVALPLPAGAATEATLVTRASEATLALVKAKTDNLDVLLSTRASEATLGTLLTQAQLATELDEKLGDLGQKTMAGSAPVVIASDQSAVPVSAASLPLPTGAAQEHTTAASPSSVRLSDGAAFYDAAKTGQLPAALVGGRLDENVGAWLGSTAPTVGSKTSANSVPVVIASDQAAVAISAASLPLPTGAATAANQTTLGSQTSKINDGTNTAAVKAASTAAVATDPALVVAISPNNGISFNPSVVGAHANAWSAAAVGANGTSTAIDCQYTPNVTVFGNTSGNTNITVQFSQDNANFYDGVSQNANGDFSISGTWGARYIRLKSGTARTITATIAGKD